MTKSRDVYTRQRSLTFEVDYPEAVEGFQPRHRFMSAFEQKVEPPDKNFQYILFACDPYGTLHFRIFLLGNGRSSGGSLIEKVQKVVVVVLVVMVLVSLEE